MKTIGIKILPSEIVLVVLEKNTSGQILQTEESIKLNTPESTNAKQLRDFRNLINSTFDSISPQRIGILARNANGKNDYAPSPVSFKYEGIIQLYDRIDIEFIWKATLVSHFKHHPKTISEKLKYQIDAFDVALYLMY